MSLPKEGELWYTRCTSPENSWLRCTFRAEPKAGYGIGAIEKEIWVASGEPAIVLYSGFALEKVLMSCGVVWVSHRNLTREHPNNVL